VFVVGYLGDWRRAAAVLFERESLLGNPAPRREAGEGTAAGTAQRPSGGGGLGTDFDCDGGLIAHALRAEGFDASEDGTGRGTPLVPVAFSIMPMNSGKDYKARETDIAQPIMAGGPVGGNQGGDFIVDPVPFDTTQITAPANYSKPKAGDPCHPLAAGAHAPAIAFGWQNSARQGASASASVTPTLDKSKTPAIACNGVRRLTPRECERLQGFPDDYTLVPYRNKPAADGPRYKALGNSMAVPVMAWIGRRIGMVESLIERAAA
jgi:DNA (cytosine-5)-methyltransferase 1